MSVEPIHKEDTPVIVCAVAAPTVRELVAVFIHPPTVTEYVINEVPAETPVTNPVASIEATAGSELDHVPPGVVLVHVSVEPTHNDVNPVNVCGRVVVIVIVCVAETVHDPTVTVYVIRDVPAEIPVIKPELASILAIEGFELVQVPPEVVLAHVVVDPSQIEAGPEIVSALGPHTMPSKYETVISS